MAAENKFIAINQEFPVRLCTAEVNGWFRSLVQLSPGKLCPGLWPPNRLFDRIAKEIKEVSDVKPKPYHWELNMLNFVRT